MGLATTGGAEVEGESQVKKSRRAIGTGGRLAGLRLRLRLRLAGWLLYIYRARPGLELGTSRVRGYLWYHLGTPTAAH